MNEQFEPERSAEARRVQQELEQQLRAFGDTMSDAFAHGFEGRGMDIGDRAYDVGRAAVHAANFGIGEAVRAFRSSRQRQQTAGPGTAQGLNEGYAGVDTTGMPAWLRQIFGGKSQLTPVENVRVNAKKRYNTGIALFVVGITFTLILLIGGISCLAAAGMIGPAVISEVTLQGGASYALSTAQTGSLVLKIVGSVLTLTALGFGWMTAVGAGWMSAGKKLNLFADAAESMDYKKGLPVEMLADLTHQKKSRALKKLRKYIRKGWLNAWLDESTEKVYLTAEDYRAAQQAAEPVQQPEAEAASPSSLNLETARRFAAVLQQEKQLMQDEMARDELAQMEKTTNAICDWLEAHPESMPKARRFAEYYIPTTLKLLHTYNDVQGQKGGNAESIRRDIAGILHTLNQAYTNLYDNLLSDVAMDVSSEIAALQGMLANDGLTGRDFV